MEHARLGESNNAGKIMSISFTAKRGAWRAGTVSHRSIAPIGLVLFGMLLGVSCSHHESPVAPGTSSAYANICADAAQSLYILPYPVGTTCQVYQGYPPFNHPPEMLYAIDFLMPQRSIVVAARGGVVLAIEQGYDDNDSALGHENFVILDHGDGTFSRYVHLVKNGALVQRGQRLEAGESVGLSGRTGSTLDHLHFDITVSCSTRDCQTIPACFRNTRAHPNGLQRGEYYRAEPY